MKAIISLNKKRKFAFATSVLVMLAGILTAYMYFYGQPKDLSNVDAVKERISQHYVLPSNEQPALVTITDNSKLTSEFLKQSKNGDKVLIYQSNRKAVIYRPSIDRIVDVAPVVIDGIPTAR